MGFICPDCGKDFGRDKTAFEQHRSKQHPHAPLPEQSAVKRLSKESQKRRDRENTKYPEEGFPYLIEKLKRKKPRKTDGGEIRPPEIQVFDEDGTPYAINVFYGHYTAYITYEALWKLTLTSPYSLHDVVGEWVRYTTAVSAAELLGKLENRWKAKID